MENILRGAVVWDMKLIRIKVSKKCGFFFPMKYYHTGHFT